MNENMELYNKVREVPKEAQKTIGAGRLKGFTDINPQWRIQMLTETFGACGFGWKYTITDKRIIEGADGVQCGFVDIDLFVRDQQCGEWSEAIPGTGGSSFVANEKSGKYTSDEVFKMALTDAISVACKALGFGADVYWADGRTKYNPTKQDEPPKQTKNTKKDEPPKQDGKKELTPREELILLLKNSGVKVAEFATKHNVTTETTDERFRELIEMVKRELVEGGN